MNDPIELPAELAHLIEKREQEERRAAMSKPPIPDSPIPNNGASTPTDTAERRSGDDRRGS